MRPTTSACWWLLLVLMGAGCATKRIATEVVWPPPPDVARIRYVTSFRDSAGLDQSTGTEMLRGLLGGGRDVSVLRPMGLALSNDGKRLYIADMLSNAVFVADFEAKSLKSFAPKFEGKPFGVAVDAADNVYISNQTSRSIDVFDKAGTGLRSFGAESFLRPAGLAIDQKRGLLYVADPARQSDPVHRVLAFSVEGKFEREIGKGRGSEDGQFNFPMYLAVDGQGRLFVADLMNFRVQVFDSNGTFLAKYGQNGDMPGSFSRMKGLAHDSYGNLYVVESASSVVQMFDPNFAPLMHFGGEDKMLEALDGPTSIAIDPATNRIYVGNTLNPRVNVYELINAEVPAGEPTK